MHQRSPINQAAMTVTMKAAMVRLMPGTVHKINRSRSVHRVVVVGCGGTGSAVIGGLPFLHQALLAAGYPGLHVTVADGDKVTATNCVRQPFWQEI
jgi:tRNA A37 threonylcarbamoyladenosine dehydratase